MIFSTCERFPGMTPFNVRRERARTFFEVFLHLTKYLNTKAKQKNQTQVIRKPAGDNWF